MTHGRRFSRALSNIKADGRGRNRHSLAEAICCELFKLKRPLCVR